MLITNRAGGDKLHTALNRVFDAASDVVIASAYVTPGACELLRLLDRASRATVRLAIGRAFQEGVSDPAREYLLRLDNVARIHSGGVRVDPTGWHSKLYGAGDVGVIGSSNLTEHGLSDWVEANLLTSGADGAVVVAEAQRLWNSGVAFSDAVDEVPKVQVATNPGAGGSRDARLLMPAEPSHPTPGVEISLLDRSGQVPAKSGLNWGLAGGRPRDRYEAYIRFPIGVHDTAEFVFGATSLGTQVVAHTHDGKQFRLLLEGTSSAGETVAKQISTLGNKSLLGRWMINDCLGIMDGRAVTLADLQRYGRTSVAFYRTGTLPDGTAVVYLDFSKR